jgi:hypothetical protein
MPRRPRSLCPIPGCPELTTGGRCPTHAREAAEQRGTTTPPVLTRVHRVVIHAVNADPPQVTRAVKNQPGMR